MTDTDGSNTIRELEDRLSIISSPMSAESTVVSAPASEEPELTGCDRPEENQQHVDKHEDLSPSLSSTSSSSSSRPNPRRANDRLTSIARTAVRATKEQFWDSNEPGIVAAQTAVDRWEEIYVWFRNAVVASSRSVAGIYNASKAGARNLDQGLLVPVRDYMLLPTFGFAEHVVRETSSFVKSSEAQRIQRIAAEGSTAFVSRAVPFGLGDTVVLPAVRLGSETMQKVWNVARYPVPSQRRVRDTVDLLLNGSKKNLSICGREIIWYFRRADANIARTLRRTQWVVLGSGPYETLDVDGRKDVMDHVCERYLSIGNNSDRDDDETDDYTTVMVARYEFMANVRACNRSLYSDLVETGLLKERGGASTKDDEWLSKRPRYRSQSADLFLLDEKVEEDSSTVFALWFRLPFENGKRPKKDVPWVLFDHNEGKLLEEKYRSILEQPITLGESSVATTATSTQRTKRKEELQHQKNLPDTKASVWGLPKYATNAKWYNPDLSRDLLLDQRRHAVTFVRCSEGQCEGDSEVVAQEASAGCDEYTPNHNEEKFSYEGDSNSCRPWEADCLMAPPPPLVGLYKPTMWRSYGPDEVRRAVWFLDTPRHGPQPYGEDAQALLEDAYQFLKWKICSKRGKERASAEDTSDDNGKGGKNENENVLLTVQVASPETNEQQLVQFMSLTLATAISKGLGGAISLFKRRVYRGAYNYRPRDEDSACMNKFVEGEGPMRTEEDLGWNTTTEVALEKLSLDISPTDLATSKEAEEERINIEYSECFKDFEQEQVFAESVGISLDENDHLSSIHSESSGSDGPSLAFQMERSGRDLADIEADHLILVVHGIGEMMQAFDFFGLKKVPTIVDCCGYLRDNHAEVSNVRFAKIPRAADCATETNKSGRVEYLPIEWHEAFSIQSTRRQLNGLVPPRGNKNSRKICVNDISLRTIPNLRSFANDTLMDILYFMSPAHHDIIIDIVSFELNFVVDRFRKLTGFKGEVSIIGHSIGSVIAWDILDHQRMPSSSQSSTTNEDLTLAKVDDSYRYPQLKFEVDTVYLLGSPIPVFLMIRNQEKPLSETFTLSGCPRVFNIFHPYDPVSYRIEPLIHPKNSEIEPDIMMHWNGGFRFQYQTKRLWKKIVDQTLRAEMTVIHRLESGIEALGLVDSTFGEHGAREDENGGTNDQDPSQLIITGSLNGGRRVDYMLQEKEIDRANEYVAALAAHSCYWLEKDLSLFIANEICQEKKREQGVE